MTGAPPCRSTRVQTKAATRLPLNLNSYLRSPRSQLDYERVTPSFFAISAVKNNTIYYSRCNFSHSAILASISSIPSVRSAHGMRSSPGSACRCVRCRNSSRKPEDCVDSAFSSRLRYFHPGARFRLKLRLAACAFASGAVLGAVAILAVHVSYSEPENRAKQSLRRRKTPR